MILASLRGYDMGTLCIRPLRNDDREAVREELRSHWGSTEIWSLGRRHHADALPGYVAEFDGLFGGLVTLHYDEGGWQCEVVTLSTPTANRGAGGGLLAAAEADARSRGCRRIYLTTTNDNTRAIRFYQRRGWALAALHRGIVDRAREFEPGLPRLGFDGIPIRDEIEFERWLS